MVWRYIEQSSDHSSGQFHKIPFYWLSLHSYFTYHISAMISGVVLLNKLLIHYSQVCLLLEPRWSSAVMLSTRIPFTPAFCCSNTPHLFQDLTFALAPVFFIHSFLDYHNTVLLQVSVQTPFSQRKLLQAVWLKQLLLYPQKPSSPFSF
jgi:hypothetical protein